MKENHDSWEPGKRLHFNILSNENTDTCKQLVQKSVEGILAVANLAVLYRKKM